MSDSRADSCARCGKPLQPSYRFCPECSLPVSGGEVLSDRIQELRHREEDSRRVRETPQWMRMLLPASIAGMVFFVVGVGVVVFNRSIMERFFPSTAAVSPETIPLSPAWEPEWITIPAGTYQTGQPLRLPEGPPEGVDPEDPAYYIQREGITNERWAEFLQLDEAYLRDSGLWDEADPGDLHDWIESGERGFPSPRHGDEDRLVSGVSLRAVERYYDWTHLGEVPYEFLISKHEVRNELWYDFLRSEEERLREAGVWVLAVPGAGGGWVQDADGRWRPPKAEFDTPVRNVSAEAAWHFCAWLTKRLHRPGWRIRLPRPEEWESAARGKTWQVYPWGDEFLGTPAPGTGGNPRPRSGIEANQPLPVTRVVDDVSPTGVVAMGSNVAEWVDWGRDFRDPVRVTAQIRGASFGDSASRARWRARIWDKSDMDPRQRLTYTGVRLVKVRTYR